MKVKVSEASGPVLDWMVTKALGCELTMSHDYFRRIALFAGWSDEKITEQLSKSDNHACVIDTVGNTQTVSAYSTIWAQGGSIIERERITTEWLVDEWCAECRRVKLGTIQTTHRVYGPTPLIAAMRCYVVSKLGEEVEVPDELVKEN